MEIEIAAVITIASKLPLLEKLLERRIVRASLDTVSPALPLLEKVYTLGEYKRLAANLAVMEHRIRCALGEEDTRRIADAAVHTCGLDFCNRQVKAAVKRAAKVLQDLGVSMLDLQGYKQLPLYNAECNRLTRLKNKSERVMPAVYAAACACSPVGRTARA